MGEDMGAEGIEGGAKGAYKGNQGAASGIIGMLEVAESDFSRLLSEATAIDTKTSAGKQDLWKFSLPPRNL